MSSGTPTSSSLIGTIRPMDVNSIQRIAAGQAITDLASCVKELIDNALDAGSTKINIRLFNQGLDIVEVTDDGCGVPVESRPYLAMKHATSKIQSFQDIYKTSSLGFRGEALFCLANLSRTLVVATRTAEEDMGQKLQFRSDGSLIPESMAPVPRKVGTTVAVVQLFDALPVRRADMAKRIQAQRQKVFMMVQSYAILCLGVRFNLMDMVGNGGEHVKLRTAGGTTKLEETVSSVVGSRFLTGMSRISIDLTKATEGVPAKVEGLISNAPKLGNEARELQLFSINGRPVELPKVSRYLLDAWRTLEGGNQKRPACVLQFTLPQMTFDINLSPDKRQVLLTNELVICDLILEGVMRFWGGQVDGKFVSNDAGTNTQPPMSPTEDGPVEEAGFKSPLVKARRRMAFVHDFRSVKLQHDEGSNHLQGTKTPPRSVHVTPEVVTTPESLQPQKQEQQQSHRPVRTSTAPSLRHQKTPDSEKRQWTRMQQSFHQSGGQEQDLQSLQNPSTPQRKAGVVSDDSSVAERPTKKTNITLEDFAFRPLTQAESTPRTPPVLDRYSRRRGLPPERLQRSPAEHILPSPAKKQKVMEVGRSRVSQPTQAERIREKDTVAWDAFQGTDAAMRASREARLQLEERRRQLKASKASRVQNGSNGESVETLGEGNESSAKMVSLTKKDFGQMEIIGQFNLGFILAKCKNNHLWILDQHACDEKYNFERLCATTQLHEQPLMAPMPLELSPAEEDCVLENMEIFEANGFRFEHDPSKPPRHRLSLTALPHSGARDGCKAVQFGKDDVGALCAVLGAEGSSYSANGGTGVDGTGQYSNNAVRRYATGSLSQNGEKVMARLPKAIAMFANRACRGSIMIGKALSQKEMQAIVERLGQVEHPWNCPHGRPTMRHVRDLLPVMAHDEKRSAQHIAGPTVAVIPFSQGEGDE